MKFLHYYTNLLYLNKYFIVTHDGYEPTSMDIVLLLICLLDDICNGDITVIGLTNSA